jgi:glycosyltransferase involved in cell wall biosynthesis
MNAPLSPLRVGIDMGGLLLHGRAPGTVKMVRQQSEALLGLKVPWIWCLAVPEKIDIPFPVPDGVDIHRLPGDKVSVFSIWTAGRLWDRLGCVAAFAPGAIAPWCRTPVLATYFDSNIFEHGWTWIASGQIRSLLCIRLLAWHTFRASRRLLINSEYCRNQLMRYKPRYAGKMFVNHCGTNPPRPPPARPPDWAASMLGRPFILNVGAFSENKGQERLLKAWRLLQQRHTNLPCLILIGPCSETYRVRNIAPAVTALPRPHDVIMPGHVEDEDWSWAFHHATGYVQPSIAEGFSSFSVYDAMYCRVPVACSNSTSHPEGTAGAARYFDPMDAEDMALAIEQTWRDPSLRENLIASGERRVRQLSWQSNAETVIEHLHALIGITS